MLKYLQASVLLLCLPAAAAVAEEANPLSGLDLDGDGQVTVDEAVAVRMQGFFRADANQDGALDEAEHAAMMASARARYGIPEVPPQPGQIDPFTFADKDADGRVTAEEFNAVSVHLVRSMDRNGDGVITLPEAGDS
jgi:hypothetical protein